MLEAHAIKKISCVSHMLKNTCHFFRDKVPTTQFVFILYIITLSIILNNSISNIYTHKFIIHTQTHTYTYRYKRLGQGWSQKFLWAGANGRTFFFLVGAK
jgi:hypothetical protein